MKWFLYLTFMLFVLAACTASRPQPTPLPVLTGTPAANLPNPASVYCEQQGNRLEIRTGADGSQIGVCIFSDGSECDEWAYYRGECQPGISQATPQTAVKPAVIEPIPGDVSGLNNEGIADDGCAIYENKELGYRFHYPADATIVKNDNPLNGISIIGPVIDDVSWPAFGLAHPQDREEYRPPEGVNLLQWLTDHYLLGETLMPDVQIAGTTAIHLHHDRSPQTFASESYYFARAGQLYVIDILHAADREDWELYNHFLESFEFVEIHGANHEHKQVVV